MPFASLPILTVLHPSRRWVISGRFRRQPEGPLYPKHGSPLALVAGLNLLNRGYYLAAIEAIQKSGLSVCGKRSAS